MVTLSCYQSDNCMPCRDGKTVGYAVINNTLFQGEALSLFCGMQDISGMCLLQLSEATMPSVQSENRWATLYHILMQLT